MTGTAKTSKQESSNSNGSDRQHLQRCTDQSIVFARNHQCAPPLYAIYVIPWVYETLQPEWQIEQFNYICRAHDRDQYMDRQINPSYSPEITNVHPHYMQFMWFLGSTKLCNLNGRLSSSAIFAGLTIVTNIQTDRSIHRIHQKSPMCTPTICNMWFLGST